MFKKNDMRIDFFKLHNNEYYMNGFIYPIVDYVIKGLCKINLVEAFKYIAKSIEFSGEVPDYSREDHKRRAMVAANHAIDLYQLFKYLSLLLVWLYGKDDTICLAFSIYLLLGNVFTYFYYHTWGSGYVQRVDRDSVNRRFMNLIFAIVFYILGFAYLYDVHFSKQIEWPLYMPEGVVGGVYLSVSIAFTMSGEDFRALTQTVGAVFAVQHLMAFSFFAIILGNSIPSHQKGN